MSSITELLPSILRKSNVLFGIVLALTLTSLTYLLAVSLGWFAADEINILEAGAGGLSYLATYLCIKQRRAYALVGIVGSIAWSIIFFQSNLLASGVVNLYLAGMLVYGYWRWGKDDQSRPVRQLQLRWAPVYLLVTAAIYLGAVWLTSSLGGSFAFWDAAILVFTILAQLLQDQKIILAWFAWGAVNIAGVILYWNSGIYFAFIQQAIFGLANIWGYLSWKATVTAPAIEKEKANA